MKRQISFNENEYNRAVSTANASLKTINEILIYLKENNLELTTDEFKELLFNGFSYEKCNEIAENKFTELKPKRLQKISREEFSEDLDSIRSNFPLIEIYNRLDFISFGKNKIEVNKTALADYKEKLTYSISTPEELALADLHIELCEKLTEFIGKAQKHNQFWEEYWFQLFKRNEKTFLPTQIKYS